MVRNLPVMQETRVQSQGWEVPLDKEMAIHSSILAWRIPWTEEPGKATVHGVTMSQARHLINALGVYSGHSLEKRLKKARVEAGILIMKGLQEFRR